MRRSLRELFLHECGELASYEMKYRFCIAYGAVPLSQVQTLGRLVAEMIAFAQSAELSKI